MYMKKIQLLLMLTIINFPLFAMEKELDDNSGLALSQGQWDLLPNGFAAAIETAAIIKAKKIRNRLENAMIIMQKKLSEQTDDMQKLVTFSDNIKNRTYKAIAFLTRKEIKHHKNNLLCLKYATEQMANFEEKEQILDNILYSHAYFATRLTNLRAREKSCSKSSFLFWKKLEQARLSVEEFSHKFSWKLDQCCPMRNRIVPIQ